MDRLKCLEIFAEVARRGNFAAVAQSHSMSRSAVSKHVAWLEEALGARLLTRTTKEVALTDAGRLVLQGSLSLISRYDEIASEVRHSLSSPSGVVRVGTPPSFGLRHLLPLVMQFVSKHPEIEVEMDLDDGRASLVSGKFDLSMRIAPSLDDSSHIAQALLKAPQVLVASPDYLGRAGIPSSLTELVHHECLVNTQKSPTGIWRFVKCGTEISLRVRGSLRSNYGEALQWACLRGQGLSIHPRYMVEDDIVAGRLVPILCQTPPIGLDIYVIYPMRESVPKRVRAFLEFLRDWAQSPPPWSTMQTELVVPDQRDP